MLINIDTNNWLSGVRDILILKNQCFLKPLHLKEITCTTTTYEECHSRFNFGKVYF